MVIDEEAEARSGTEGDHSDVVGHVQDRKGEYSQSFVLLWPRWLLESA